MTMIPTTLGVCDADEIADADCDGICDDAATTDDDGCVYAMTRSTERVRSQMVRVPSGLESDDDGVCDADEVAGCMRVSL